MAIILSERTKSFLPAPAGLHSAVCCDVIDLGEVETAFGNKHKVELRWLIDEMNQDDRPYLVSKRYTASLNERATLRADLESWRGAKFTAGELKAFDLESMIGRPCMVQVVHAPSADGTRTWANVSNVVPLAKGMTPMAATDYIRKVDRDLEQRVVDAFDAA